MITEDLKESLTHINGLQGSLSKYCFDSETNRLRANNFLTKTDEDSLSAVERLIKAKRILNQMAKIEDTINQILEDETYDKV